ncbi:hypothetical protein SAMN02745857_01101 [Andreprevotia lacus DSM 23236]|jgi:hypothetical protein|uniref:RiboL-PSP-HEPN domain-containing protein n=1 Tax=Andreprevotia lacus DSM 23236 TaxID=1121001 RepID=A0A1W1XBW2_9NEIS|nr:hypothetical protein [Andreprevotia lacus]SMC21001.1 hypothetical protein SAMN02745857_01101 [Andreprevotia lacus DSM 23236]
MKFNRDATFSEYTLAWRLFKRHHTHFNDIYWANQATLKFAYASTRPYSRTDSATKIFSLPDNPQRLADTLGDWADNYSEFNQWAQMAAVIAICGYLETYIAQVATAALESRPALIFGGSAQVDGTTLLKLNNTYDFYSHAEHLVRGDWSARISAYTRLFGSCPYANQVKKLDQLRKLRNDAGHSFGRDITKMRFSESSFVQPLPKISNEKIKEFLDLAHTVSQLADNHLGPSYIGSYEVVRLFHIWKKELKNYMPLNQRELAQEFSRHFNSVTGSQYGKQRAEALIRYYNTI